MFDLANIETSDSPPNRKPPYLTGLFVSSVVHVVTVLCLFAAPVFWVVSKVDFDKHTIVVFTSAKNERDKERKEVKVATEPDEVTNSIVEKKLNEAIEHAQSESTDESLGKLDGLAERLDRVSSDESIDKLTDEFRGWLGTKKRATQPAEESVAGEFDFDTAQLHDVRRDVNDDQSWTYWAVMIDAEGRLTEVEMTLSEGETMYKTMQRMKAFPLVDKVYRQITMPLIDKLLQSKKANARDGADTE